MATYNPSDQIFTSSSWGISEIFIWPAFSRYSTPIHWLVHGYVTSNNENYSRQMPRVINYDFKRETGHSYPRNVHRCCTWSEEVDVALESQRVFQNLLLPCFAIWQIGFGRLCSKKKHILLSAVLIFLEIMAKLCYFWILCSLSKKYAT